MSKDNKQTPSKPSEVKTNDSSSRGERSGSGNNTKPTYSQTTTSTGPKSPVNKK